MTIGMFDWQALYDQLHRWGLDDWADELEQLCSARTSPAAHGTLSKWSAAWESLPQPDAGKLVLEQGQPAITVAGHAPDPTDLQAKLMEFHPWRKGPFKLFEVEIDTEWRSDWKWQRLSQHFDFRDQTILDVGSGNGYYGWQMLCHGACFVLGCDPFLLYVAQYEVLRRYAKPPVRHFVVPLTDDELPSNLRFFDTTISMGVLYHRTSPIDHLQKMLSTLKPQGQLILETLIVDSTDATVLVPKDRYAKMRNVWFLPSLPMLEVWLSRVGFTDIRILDVTQTSPDEQRKTQWMTFESLEDFLDSRDPELTIEGYPAPLRAMLSARRKS